jgi:hypothetical protein
VGDHPKMHRDSVTSDPHVSCSAGLHVAAFNYVGACYGNNTIVAVKVDPKDVCSVPYDYEGQKIRTCGYEVLALLDSKKELEHLYFPWDKEKLKTYTVSTTKSLIDLNSLSASAIVQHVLQKTKKIITISLKSKKSIITQALKLFKEASIPVSGTAAELDIGVSLQGNECTVKQEKNTVPENKKAAEAIFLSGMTAQEIVALVKKLTKKKITFNLKSKKSIQKAAEKILTEKGYPIK